MLQCDECGKEYTDQESINEALRAKDRWEQMCRRDGVEPRGACPCPNLFCPGELVLKE